MKSVKLLLVLSIVSDFKFLSCPLLYFICTFVNNLNIFIDIPFVFTRVIFLSFRAEYFRFTTSMFDQKS